MKIRKSLCLISLLSLFVLSSCDNLPTDSSGTDSEDISESTSEGEGEIPEGVIIPDELTIRY
ncbi:MAG: hypothetical protein WC282_04020, partial [Bacilli bacterium]